jgi:hypothetical protein
MNVVFVCDRCDWEGERETFITHLKQSPTCDYRDACCKLESVKDYEGLEPDEICEDCIRMLDDYYQDLWADASLEDYYEGR